MIETERLWLVPATVASLQAELAHDFVALGALIKARVAAGWPPELYDDDAIRWTLDIYERDPASTDWGFRYFVLRGAAPLLIGAGGYKGAPRDGFVELGYSVIPSHQRRGLASEAVRGMMAHAFADARVDRVIAHTLKDLTPSIGVLEKCGFTLQKKTLEEGAIQYAIDRKDWR